jgi:thiol:disulfide interchange protein
MNIFGIKNKSLFVVLLLVFFSGASFAQILNPVKWTFSSKKINDTVAELYLKATIDKGWHVYSQYIPENGPVPTSFTFEKSKDYQTIGKVIEPKPIVEFDPNFDMQLKFFAKSAVFVQKIKMLSMKPFTVKGKLEFMCCDDKQCLPPSEIEFSFKLEGATKSAVKVDTATVNTVIAKSDTTKADTLNTKNAVTSGDNDIKSKSFWWIFVMGFLGGLLALFTPCVFPMIPMTVSFFIKRSEKKLKGVRDAMKYGLSIIFIYVVLGLGITLIFGADKLNSMSTNAWANLFFFVLLIVFSAAFFGAFELQLPAKWVNAMDSKADKVGGFLGIFFMAFTLVLVSFSCTGPIIGTLLVDAAVSGNTLGPFMGMFGFSLALAIPFSLFAIFPSWLHSMPKSGGWLNSVKVVLGFLELALALKFLSTADLVSHWGILDREVFLVLWIVIFTMLGFYLLGKMKFAHDTELKHISVPRLFMALFSFSFALYMVPGLWGAPLKAISAFSPPQATQDFDLTRGKHIYASSDTITKKKYSNLFHCPHDLNCFFDYDEGLAVAKKAKKPVFIDFTGHGCVNCRNMEIKVWSDERVLKILNEDYIMISLYVDDKTDLPVNEQYTSNSGGMEKTIKTIGNKWSDLQASKYGTNSQPFYVLLDNEGKQLVTPHAFDLDIDAYVKFLEDGVKEFKKRNAIK